MSAFRPTPQQERWMVAGARLQLPADTPWLVERSGGWRSFSLLTRCAFFVLGVVAAGLTAGIMYLLRIPAPLFVAGVMAVVVAETLIVQRRLFGAGIEEALAISGLLLMLAQILGATHTYSEVSIAFWVAVAFAHAGARLLNALFATIAAALLSFVLYAAVRSDAYDYVAAATKAGVFCFGIATVALAMGAMKFSRPSVDRMLDWLVIAMPVGGYLWLVQTNWYGLTLASVQDSILSALPLLLIALFGSTALLVGIRRRCHAPLLAALLCMGGVAYELRNLTGLALEVRLIMWGTLALLLTLGLIAVLHKPRNGITSSEVEAGSGALQLLELAGVSSLATQAPTPSNSTYAGAGGNFGGGGASGKF